MYQKNIGNNMHNHLTLKTIPTSSPIEEHSGKIVEFRSREQKAGKPIWKGLYIMSLMMDDKTVKFQSGMGQKELCTPLYLYALEDCDIKSGDWVEKNGELIQVFGATANCRKDGYKKVIYTDNPFLASVEDVPTHIKNQFVKSKGLHTRIPYTPIYGYGNIPKLKVNDAIKVIAYSEHIFSVAAQNALNTPYHITAFCDMIYDQCCESESNQKNLEKAFGEDVVHAILYFRTRKKQVDADIMVMNKCLEADIYKK